MTTLYYIALALIMFSVGFIFGTARIRKKLEEANEEWFETAKAWHKLCRKREETIEELTERLEREENG